MLIVSFFVIYTLFLWLTLEGRGKAIGYLFLFQVIIAGSLNGLENKLFLVLFVVLSSVIDTRIYFILYKRGKVSCRNVLNFIEEHSLGGGHNAVDKITNLTNFGHIRSRTKNMILFSQLLLLLISLGDLYG